MPQQQTTRCTPCRGTGIYPLDIEAVKSGKLLQRYARRCGACGGYGWWYAKEVVA